MVSGRMLRHLAVRVVLCVLLIIGLSIGATATFAAEEIAVCVWGGAFTKTERIAFFDPFEKDTGIKINTVSNPSFAKMKAQVMTGNLEWDVVTAEEKWVIAGLKHGLFEKLDFSVIDTKDFLPDAVHPSGVGVLSESYTHAIAYNTNIFSEDNHPNGWKDFWDVKKFPGPRAMYNHPMMNLEQALIADGVPPDQLYPLDVERAFRSLDKIRPHILVWYKGLAQTAQMMTKEEVHLIVAGPPRMYFIQKEGAPVAVTFNQAMADKSFWVILKGSKHKESAMKLIHYITRPERQANWINQYPFGVANAKAYDYVNPEILPWIPTSPQNADKLVWLNSEWWADNEAPMLERWNEWMLKK